MGGGATSEKATVSQQGDGFKADIFVPVWTSQLYVSDWWDSAPVPLEASVSTLADGWQVQVINHTDHQLPDCRLAIESLLFALGQVPANGSKTFTLSRSRGTPIRQFVSNQAAIFPEAVQSRQQAFGEITRINDLPNSSVAVSFLSQMGQQQDYRNNYTSPPGLDLSTVLDHGNAVLLAWAPDYSPIQPIQQFTPKRHNRNTLWRVPVVISPQSTVHSS
jgi:hypothetical protein